MSSRAHARRSVSNDTALATMKVTWRSADMQTDNQHVLRMKK
jgi:hypothetical protein